MNTDSETVQQLGIDLGERSYPILIGTGLLSDTERLARHIPARTLMIVTNEVVAPLYLLQLKTALPGKRLFEIVLPDGEHTKSLETLSSVFDALIAARMNRDAAVIALGVASLVTWRICCSVLPARS
jgi:3-dehydroquinate synthase